MNEDDKNVAYLTHVSVKWKTRLDPWQGDSIIALLQQPYSLDCIHVEAEYQKEFSELLLKAASGYGTLTASIADFQWSQNFTESPSLWVSFPMKPSKKNNCRGGLVGDTDYMTPPPWREEAKLEGLSEAGGGKKGKMKAVSWSVT
ncbi:hypothetical protein BVC80_9061g15 [Macleaya cordata]|uniref:Uncharacterized protein n=1 Tax=Macleaya cordata TaxID=56857 RepID=A0A200PN13_MACCD|nr:hypothetical protein BVC80_9061g15 [Macleaya cordata]